MKHFYQKQGIQEFPQWLSTPYSIQLLCVPWKAGLEPTGKTQEGQHWASRHKGTSCPNTKLCLGQVLTGRPEYYYRKVTDT